MNATRPADRGRTGGRRRSLLLSLLLLAVVAAQIVLGTALFTDDQPPRPTTMVSVLPVENNKVAPARMAALRTAAKRLGADLLVLVVDPCAVSLWPCPASSTPAPPKGSAQDESKKPAGKPGKNPTYPGTVNGSPPVRLIVDDRELSDVADAQPPDARVVSADGQVMRPAATEEGPGALLVVWAVGLAGTLGASGWTLVTAIRGGSARVAVPPRRPTGPTPPGPRGPAASRDTTTVLLEPDSGDLVDVFLHHVAPKRPRAREPQCPRCGSFDAHQASASTPDEAFFRCQYCAFDWTIMRGAPWPTVVIDPRVRN